MTKYTITPWRSQADLLKVREQLYGSTADYSHNQRDAVERVMAWKLRGNLPHAVESTALLVDAALHHSIDGNSSFSIRAVYSAAFCRFVTGFCDIGRHRERSLEPSSMLEIARQIDMPAEFVALRHEATHEELPSIQRLVFATRQALTWLWKVYWSRLDDVTSTEDEATALVTFKEEATAELRRFRKARRDALRNQTQTLVEQQAERDRTCGTLESSCRGSRSRTKGLAEVLVQDRLLLPGSRGLGASLDGAFIIWDDFLRDLSERLPEFRRDLVTALLVTIAKPTAVDPKTDPEKEAFSMWVMHILHGNYTRRTETIALANEIMKLCCLYPGYWTQQIAREALQVDEGVQADWQDLFDVASMSSESSDRLPNTFDQSHALSGAHNEDDPMSNDKAESGLEDAESQTGWRRAITSFDTPLGVVK